MWKPYLSFVFPFWLSVHCASDLQTLLDCFARLSLWASAALGAASSRQGRILLRLLISCVRHTETPGHCCNHTYHINFAGVFVKRYKYDHNTNAFQTSCLNRTVLCN